MGLTDDQLEERRAYLGGTDAAALAGVNPPRWAQPIDVYLEKVGLAPPRTTSTAMSLGSRLEPVVADLFTDATGIKLRRHGRPVRSANYPWAGGHLDRWAADGAVFEAKWAMRTDGWGASWQPEHLAPGAWTDPPAVIVPPHYDVQVQHYLAITGRTHAWLAVLLGFGEFRWYRIARRQPFIDKLMELEGRFWHDHVLAQVPPDPDGSLSYGQHLRRTLATSDEEEAVATPEQQAMAHQLRQALEAQAQAAREVAVREQVLQQSMGTTGKLVGPDFVISWATTAPRRKVAWEALTTRLAYLAWAFSAGDPEADPELVRLIDALPGPGEWPTTKKAMGELVRQVARDVDLLTEEPGGRPWKPKYDSDEEEPDAQQ